MPTKHQLEQQLEETRADLAAEIERNKRAREREADLTYKLRSATELRDNAEQRAKHQHDRVIYLEADVARLGGMLDGMREVLTGIGVFAKGEQQHEPRPKYLNETGGLSAALDRMSR